MQLPIREISGAVADMPALNVSEKVFDRRDNPGLVHQVVVSYLANSRQGTRATKNRSEVTASGRKPWRQKGTGRARVGTAASPIWRGGGMAFALRPGYRIEKVNRRSYRAALSTVFSMLLRAERLTVVKEFSVSEPKTKVLAKILADQNLQDVLIIVEKMSRELQLAARNLSTVSVVEAAAIDPVILIRHARIIVTADAVAVIDSWLSS